MTEQAYSVKPLPAFSDNYIWALEWNDGSCAVVDPGDAEPVLSYLTQHNLKLRAILLTHHHGDHTGGVLRLLQSHPAPVYGPVASRFEHIDHPVAENECFMLNGSEFRVLEIPGHTLDHVAYFDTGPVPRLFCGDTLFAGGCGRVFEGTPPQMHHSLSKLAGLPESTEIYCAHEYTVSNLRFAVTVEPNNQLLQQRLQACLDSRERGQPTLPSSLRTELATNPFLRCDQPQVMARALQESPDARTPAEVFAAIRRLKDHF